MEPSGRNMVVAMSPDPRVADNPYLVKLADGLRAQGVDVIAVKRTRLLDADVAHVHWPDLAVADPSRGRAWRGAGEILVLGMVMRARRRPFVWTVHNLRPHESRYPVLERLFWPAFVRLLSGYVTLSKAAINQIENAHPGLRRVGRTVVPHGDYFGAYPPWPGSVPAARERLGIPVDRSALLFLGQVRPYKGVESLLTAFGGVTRADAFLAIAGGCADAQLAGRIRDLAAGDNRIALSLARVPDQDLAAWYAATVGTVLPFNAGLNSGSAFLSLTMGRPVLVPRSIVFDELAGEVGDTWVQRYEPPLRATHLADFLDHATHLHNEGGLPQLSAFNWDHLSAATASFYRELAARRS